MCIVHPYATVAVSVFDYANYYRVVKVLVVESLYVIDSYNDRL